jgi:hypothetical protein
VSVLAAADLCDVQLQQHTLNSTKLKYVIVIITTTTTHLNVKHTNQRPAQVKTWISGKGREIVGKQR